LSDQKICFSKTLPNPRVVTSQKNFEIGPAVQVTIGYRQTDGQTE